MILVDTSAWLHALRKNSHPEIKSRIDSHLASDVVFISGMIKLELLGGTRTQSEFNRLKNRLDSLAYIDSDADLWDSASQLCFDLRKKGVTLPFTDIIIAASALSQQLVLVHADRHFELMCGHTDLKTENLLPLLTSS